MRSRQVGVVCAVLVFGGTLVGPTRLSAQTLSEVEKTVHAGDYAAAAAAAEAKIKKSTWNERWPRILIESQLATGQYAEALDAYEKAILRYSSSLTLRMKGVEIYRYNNLPNKAAESERRILQMLNQSPSRFVSRDNLLAAGRYFASQGEDARRVLQLFYDRVRDADPRYVESYIATAELALQKGDYQVAADTLEQARLINDHDPSIEYLMARAWQSGDAEKATLALQKSLELNPNYVPSLLFQVETAIDREQYETAEKIISKIQAINPKNQESWGLLAVIAHLRGKYDLESQMRARALSTWRTNPEVDHLIGKKLSEKYRFEEGAEYQRRAIEFDSGYIPAQFQLAQDQLRLGHDEIGWELARDVAKADEYNVVAHNLVTLYDRLKDFSVIQRDGIHVRMDPREARIYGDEVLELLSEAKETLCAKYDVAPREPIVVEIFPEQKDFAIRTFGLPGGAGYLGVCFGRVITANSPASQGERPSNWRSVLWHEFCHVVTLEKTKNRMPRWLSEGISVYEERQHDASWGESISPTYREMLLGKDLTPVSDLSAAFLSPPSPIHLQFAYYESSLVIEFLVEKHGIDVLQNILEELGNGLGINDALQRHVGSLDKLDSEFTDYAHQVANDFGKDVDWSRETMPQRPTLDEITAWVAENPNSYWGLRALSRVHWTSGQSELAKQSLEKLRETNTFTGERDGPLELLTLVYRKLGDDVAEKDSLLSLISLSSNSLPALQRMIEISQQNDDWESVAKYAELVMAINPLLSEAHLAAAEAAEKLARPELAVTSLKALQDMQPIDPAGLDFRIAQAYTELSQLADAKHHVLRALNEAPRYRDAHRLLLQLVANTAADATDTPEESSAPEETSAPEKTSEPEETSDPENPSASEATGDPTEASATTNSE